jgi:hypothetical protein
MRIVLAGYEGEHELPADWAKYAWEASGGYAFLGSNRGMENKKRERLWLSPACLPLDKSPQQMLFDEEQ